MMPSENQLPIEQFLAIFTSEDLAEALFQLELPVSGSKAERLHRLATKASGLETASLLDTFTADSLRGACGVVGVKATRKVDMIKALLPFVASASSMITSNISAADGVVTAVPQSVAAAGIPVVVLPPQGAPVPLPLTKETVLTKLKALTLPRRKLQSEADAHIEIARYLHEYFEDVMPEYNIGGYLGLKIDIDIGNGQVGVEVKLADSLLNSAAEIHRLIGQAIYYDRRRYKGNLIVAVAGRLSDIEMPVLRELYSFLEGFGIPCVGIPGA